MKKFQFLLAFTLIISPLFCNAQDWDLPANAALIKKYSGTYQVVTDGSKGSSNDDKYILSGTIKKHTEADPTDAAATWITYKPKNEDGTGPKVQVKSSGGWEAGEGIIRLYFYRGCDECAPYDEFTLVNGQWRMDDLLLKKVVSTPAKK